jgi:predicted RecA/RadA family phage recombinase
MFDATFVKDGNVIDHTPVGNVAAGAVIVTGGLVGIATADIPAGVLGSLAVVGIFDVVSTGAITAGANVYWNGTAATATATDNIFMGKAVKAASGNIVRVRLSQ